MHKFRRLVEDAYVEKGIPEEYDEFIKGIVEAGLPLMQPQLQHQMLQKMRQQGGRATAKLNSGKVLERRMALSGLIAKLPADDQRQLLSERTLGQLIRLMEEESWPYSRSEGTLTKDLQAIKRERKKQKVVTT